MADVAHKDLSGSDLHESKGAATASAGTIQVANGAGSAVWTDKFATIKNSNLVVIPTRFEDISTAASVWAVAPIAGKIAKVYVVLNNAITTANSIVTAKINGVSVSSLSITVTQAGSAAGSVFSGTPSGNNTVAAGGAIEIITDGGATVTCIANVYLLMDVS